MNSNNIEQNNEWYIAGQQRKKRNKHKRIIKKKQTKIQKEKHQKYIQKIKEEKKQKKLQETEWRLKRIQLIKSKEFESFKTRKITTEFAQAIQSHRAKKNISRKELANILIISENDLASYENAQKCPPSQIIVKLRKLFNNLPKQYYINN